MPFGSVPNADKSSRGRNITRKAAILLLLFSLVGVCAASASATDWGAFVAASNRNDDGLILDLLKDADFATSAGMLEALGSRKDPYAEDILSWLLSRFSKTSEYKTEALIRLAMKAIFDEAPDAHALQERLAANADFIDQLVRNIARFKDPQLRGSIVRLLPRRQGPERLAALMEVGAGVIEALNQADGKLTDPDMGLAYDYLGVVRQIGNSDFMEPCLEIARLSRDSGLTQKARQVARDVGGRPR